MSYEIPGFDPTSRREHPEAPFKVWHQTINNIGIHIVDAGEIDRRIDAGGKLTLVDHTPGKRGNIKHVQASVSGGKNFDSQPAALYTARIDLRNEKDWTKQFANLVNAANFTRLESSTFYWNNTRILRRPNTPLMMQADIFNGNISLANQTKSTGAINPLQETRIKAPASADVEKGHQIVQFFDSLTAMMAVAYSLDKHLLQSPGGDLVITPDGPLYKNKDTGDYVHRVEREVITITQAEKEKKHPGFDQLFGIDDVKEQLQPVILFYKRPDLAAKWRVGRPGNILLYGPPGIGKTAIAHALQDELGADLHELNPDEIYGKWMGDSEKGIKAAFDKVRHAKKPTILLLEEMEGIVNVVDTDTSGSRTTNAVAGIFKTESARVTAENPNVIIVATTNDPDRIDSALIRAGRFDVQIEMHLPNDEARRQMYGNLILNYHSLDLGEHEGNTGDSQADFNPFSSDLLDADALAELVRITDHDFSSADIIESLRRAAINKATEEERLGTEPSPIDLAFISNVITTMRRNRT